MLLKNTAGQIIQLGALIATADGSRLITSATVRWCKDGTWAAGAGTLTVEETDQYKYAPTQGETNCTLWAVAVDHASAVQPLVAAGRTLSADVSAIVSDATTGNAALRTQLDAAAAAIAAGGPADLTAIDGSSEAATKLKLSLVSE